MISKKHSDSEQTRTCSKCKKQKPLDAYHNDKTSFSGKKTSCKPVLKYLIKSVILKIEHTVTQATVKVDNLLNVCSKTP